MDCSARDAPVSYFAAEENQRKVTRHLSSDSTHCSILKSISQLEVQLTTLRHTVSELRQQSIESLANEESFTDFYNNPWLHDSLTSGSTSRGFPHASSSPLLHESIRLQGLPCNRLLRSDTSSSYRDQKKKPRPCSKALKIFILPLKIIFSCFIVIIIFGVVVKLGVFKWITDDSKFNELIPSLFRSGSKRTFNCNVTIVVSSYAEYQKALAEIDMLTAVDLHVTSSFSHDWPEPAPLEKIDQVVSLSLYNPSSNYITLRLLHKMVNLEKFSLLKDKFTECSHSTETKFNTVAELKLLQNLTLLGTNCFDDFKILTQSLHLHNLKYFKLLNASVNDDTVEYIRDILKKSAKTLESLEFDKMAWNCNWVSSKMPQYSSLTEARFDSLPDGFVNNALKLAYPKLSLLHSKDSILEWNEFLTVLSVQSLTSLTVGVKFPDNISVVEKYFNESKHPALSAKIYAHGANENTICSLYSIKVMFDAFKILRLPSIHHCIITV